MIISASYKTDIPAFYAEWFINRLRAGYCRMVNPYNSKQHYTISLKPEDVDGIVFWTKNAGPFLAALEEVRSREIPFFMQYSINNYPRALEAGVVDAERSIEHVKSIAGRFGKNAVVWRYDPIVLSSLTDLDFHRKSFEKLARQLTESTDEVVVSFMQEYEKTKRNLNAAARENSFTWSDPGDREKRALLADLAEIAARNRMRLSVCTQPELLIKGVEPAHCIDAGRLMAVGGRQFEARLKGMREGCLCHASKDIGDYDTCPHGCVYCYAVRNQARAIERFQAHDPQGEYLFSRPTTF